MSKDPRKPCRRPGCRGMVTHGSKTGYCWDCLVEARRKAKKHLKAEDMPRLLEGLVAPLRDAAVAPKIPATPELTGEWIVIADPHVPWHDPHAIYAVCEAAYLLGVVNLVIGGDLMHADGISKYLGIARSVSLTEELLACRKVLEALEMAFERIVIVPGNHDQRNERDIAQIGKTGEGKRALERLAGVLGVSSDPEAISQAYLEHFLGSPKVTIHPLPDVVINGTWLVQHPGTCSRVAPQNERGMVHKHRKSVIQGHSHLFAIGFDDSATDVCANIGHLSDTTKYRYIRERPTKFPMTVQGFCAILQTAENREGYIVPIALHPRWFSLPELARRLQQRA